MKFNPSQHIQNRNKVSQKYLKPFYGKFVAWRMDGKRILASAQKESALYLELEKRALPLDHVVVSYVPFPSAVFLGGLFMEAREGKP